MGQEIPSLGEFELRVLRIVWEQQSCTDRQVWEAIEQERTVARTTVLKTMQRLEDKQLLRRVPGTSPVQFRALIGEERVVPQLVRRFVDGILGGSAEPLVAYLGSSTKLTARELKSLEAIAQKVERQV